jgi:hypothetical protein
MGVVVAAAAAALPIPAAAQAGCEPDGNISYLCGLGTVEDLVAVPGTKWILGGQVGATRGKPAGFYLVDTRAHTISETMPDWSGGLAAPFQDCPGSPDPSRFIAHGISLRPRGSGSHQLYVVNHGGREAVEVFEVDLAGAAPSIRWRGCIIAPPRLSANGIAYLPDGGIAVTSFGVRGDPASFGKIVSGEPAGAVYEWHPGRGWSELPGTSFPGDNGIAASTDGKTLFVASWGDATLRVVARAGGPVKTISLGDLHPDNVHLSSSGELLVAGQIAEPKVILDCARSTEPVCGFPYRVVAVNPATLTVRTLLSAPGGPRFGGASAAAEADGELWIGTFRGNRIAFTSLR